MNRDDIDFQALMIAAAVMLVVIVVAFLSALLVMP